MRHYVHKSQEEHFYRFAGNPLAYDKRVWRPRDAHIAQTTRTHASAIMQ